MIPELRRAFNAAYTPEKYRQFLELLRARCGTEVAFRNSETPCFFPEELLAKMERYGRELVTQLLADPAYLAAAEQTIPAAHRAPNGTARPLFVQADFGLDERGEPMLVEIQGFPSLYCYQPTLAETYRDAYGLDPSLKTLLGGLGAVPYREKLRRAVVGEHDPENVVLLEIEPQTQKTLPDFLLTEKMLGVRAVCVTDVRREGRRLFYERDGRRVPIQRIYNRVIVDELVRKNVRTGFDLRDEIDAEWAGHPDWYFLISKFSLPYLKHPSVPETHFLDRVTTLPDDLENWVLKPLFSFAGLGVTVGPTRADVEAVPEAERSQYILQRRVHFIPTVETPHGPTKAEIRVMYLWPDDAPEPEALTALIRMGRGKMMGVDHNRDLEWVGASAAFTP